MEKTLYFLIDGSFVAEVTLIESGPINFLHYLIFKKGNDFKEGHFTFSKHKDIMTDFRKFAQFHPNIRTWRPIEQFEFNSIRKILNKAG